MPSSVEPVHWHYFSGSICSLHASVTLESFLQYFILTICDQLLRAAIVTVSRHQGGGKGFATGAPSTLRPHELFSGTPTCSGSPRGERHQLAASEVRGPRSGRARCDGGFGNGRQGRSAQAVCVAAVPFSADTVKP